MINDKNYSRRYVIAGIAVLVVLTYIIRLFVLQVIDQSTQGKAETNAQLRQTVYPSRGLIYDRNGDLIVANQPIYEVTVTVHEMQSTVFDTVGFCEKLRITLEEFNDRMRQIANPRKNRGYSRFSPQVLWVNCDRKM